MQNKLSEMRVAKRGIWYFIRTVLLVLLVIALAVGIFSIAMRIGNLYIIATEGMQLRTEYILQKDSELAMQEYFTSAFLSSDKTLQSSEYDDYNITSFDYRIEAEGFSVWPWSTTAEMTIIERMHKINGSILESKIPADAPNDAEYPIPEWEPGKYRLHFVLDQDRWYIDQIEWIGPVTEAEAQPTPDMSLLDTTTEG